VIADARFAPPLGGVRALRFVPRAALPLETACLVANRVADTLRELLGARCELVMGEPAALDGAAWGLLAREAFLFLTRGRQTDVVLLLPQADARRLVLHAFGEDAAPGGPGLPDAACSALELHALERIAARCAAALEPLGARAGESRPVRAGEAPACVAYVDLRVRAPLPLTLGIGIVRALPAPAPAGGLGPRALDELALEARAVFGEGTIDAAAFVKLQPGDVVRLDSQVGSPACLNIGGQRLATGIAGVVASRTAFLVHDVATGAPR
jgi:flagellar motor switch/type III secretory pathway protein FliN